MAYAARALEKLGRRCRDKPADIARKLLRLVESAVCVAPRSNQGVTKAQMFGRGSKVFAIIFDLRQAEMKRGAFFLGGGLAERGFGGAAFIVGQAAAETSGKFGQNKRVSGANPKG